MAISTSSPQTPRRQTELKQLESLGFGTYISAKRKVINHSLGTITQNGPVMSIVAGICILITGRITISTWLYYQTLNSQAPELKSLKTVDTSILMSNEQTKALINNQSSIEDIITIHQEHIKEQKKYQTIINTLQQPLTHLLQQIYLPSLNIRKDPRLGHINSNLIGKQFLEKNPYNDITLIQTWSRFFKEVGNGEQYNEVQDIRIGSITERPDGFFSLPITLSFNAPDKRSFLFLIDKISLTSHRPNLLLINEFTTNLRSAIKDQKADTLSGMMYSGYQSIISGDISTDRLIGALIYHQLNPSNTTGLSLPTLIDKDIIQSTVIMSAGCDPITTNVETCILQFREKYRGIPQLAYPLTDSNEDIVSALVSFYRSIPPLLQIDNFSFVKQRPTAQSKNKEQSYKGQISMTIYGKGLTNSEHEEIKKELGTICLGNNTPLTVEAGLERITTKILALSQSTSSVTTSESQQFVQLQQTFTTIAKQFPTLGNYQKTIRIFEIYRMLNDSGLCK